MTADEACWWLKLFLIMLAASLSSSSTVSGRSSFSSMLRTANIDPISLLASQVYTPISDWKIDWTMSIVTFQVHVQSVIPKDLDLEWLNFLNSVSPFYSGLWQSRVQLYFSSIKFTCLGFEISMICLPSSCLWLTLELGKSLSFLLHFVTAAGKAWHQKHFITPSVFCFALQSMKSIFRAGMFWLGSKLLTRKYFLRKYLPVFYLHWTN